MKWPFIRVLGIQEPASVVFSLFNGVAVAVGYCHFLTHSSGDYHLHGPLRVQMGVSALANTPAGYSHYGCVGFSQRMDLVNCIPHQRSWMDREIGLLQCRANDSVWAGGAVHQVTLAHGYCFCVFSPMLLNRLSGEGNILW